jgi:hypothetical protein
VGVRKQLTEPWGIVTAVLLGGLGGAVTAALAPVAVLGLPIGLGIAGVVYGVRVALGAATDRTPAGVRTPALPIPPRGSPADRWLRRADAALAGLRYQAATPTDAILRGQVENVDDQAAGVVDDLRRLGGQVTIVEQTLGRMHAGRLAQQGEQLRRDAATSTGALHDEKQRAVRAVDDQIKVYERLSHVRQTQLARMESAVLGLEGLAARLGELVALQLTSDAGGTTTYRLTELTEDLDGLRAGLAETEELSRRVLDRG